jgi:hypothetical protein
VRRLIIKSLKKKDMKNKKRIDGRAKTAKAIAAPKNNISYKVEKKGNIGFNRYFIQTPMSDFEKVKVVYVVDHFHLTSKNGIFPFPDIQSKEFFDPDPLVARRKEFEYALSIRNLSDKIPIENLTETNDDQVEMPKELSRRIIITNDWCTVSFIEYGAPGMIQVYFEGHNEHSAPYLAYELKMLRNLGYAKNAKTVTILDFDGVTCEILAEDNSLKQYKKSA